MWRDIWLYLQALWKHWASLLAGPTATVILLVWQVFARTNIPSWVFWLVALTGIPLAGFLAWRDEHMKVLGQASAEQLEEQRRLRDRADKMVDEYVALARPRHDAGPHALATLGLHALKSDALIRDAIQLMHERTGLDPWSGYARFVEGVDLVKFFERVQEMKFDFLRDGTVEDVTRKVKAADGYRPR